MRTSDYVKIKYFADFERAAADAKARRTSIWELALPSFIRNSPERRYATGSWTAMKGMRGAYTCIDERTLDL